MHNESLRNLPTTVAKDNGFVTGWRSVRDSHILHSAQKCIHWNVQIVSQFHSRFYTNSLQLNDEQQ